MAGDQRVLPRFIGDNSRPELISASSPLPVGNYPFNTLGNGVVTVSPVFTMKQVSASSVATKEVTIQADTANTGKIVVGASPVYATPPSVNGFILAAGNAITLPVSNLNKLWIDSTVVSEKATYIYLR